eukprot:Opistho-2@3377
MQPPRLPGERDARLFPQPSSRSPSVSSLLQRGRCDSDARHPRKVLILWGREDSVVPYEHCLEYLRRMQTAELHTVEGASHAILLEAPDECALAILDFMRADC